MEATRGFLLQEREKVRAYRSRGVTTEYETFVGPVTAPRSAGARAVEEGLNEHYWRLRKLIVETPQAAASFREHKDFAVGEQQRLTQLTTRERGMSDFYYWQSTGDGGGYQLPAANERDHPDYQRIWVEPTLSERSEAAE